MRSSTIRRHARLALCVAMVIACCLSTDAPARRRPRRATQQTAAVKEKRSELARLRAQIQSYETRLKQLERTEHSSVQRLDAVSQQVHLLRTLIARLNDEEGRLTRDIALTEHEIAGSESQLKELKAQYARAVVAMYKRGSQSDLELLLTAHSVGEAIERTEYLKRFSARRARLADNIAATVRALRDQRASLTEQRDEKSAAAAEKEEQTARLSKQASQREQLIARIRNDKASLKETLARTKQSAHAIESIIEKLVARERAHEPKVASRSPAREGTRDMRTMTREERAERAASDATGFGALRGSLRWPCAGRRIVERFGEHTNPALGTVTMNLGVNIRSPKNADVFAVADGIVSIVYYLPSFGNLVIIDHHGGYRTVYANLADVAVRQGEHVHAGQVIAHSDATAEAGEVVHFEIWREREKLDPEGWLAGR